jgi:hypothetical protein
VPSNHIAQIENNTTSASGDVLVLSLSNTATPGPTNRFISFRNDTDSVGGIEGDGSGGVQFSGSLAASAADFAEYLPKVERTEKLAPGTVVGLLSGRVSRRTVGADRALVVTSRPLVLGNKPEEEALDDYAPVAFLGQVPVQVRGRVEAGNLVVASGLEDGTAIAISAEELDLEILASVVGRAVTGSEDEDLKLVEVMVGVEAHHPLLALLEKRDRELRRLQSEKDDLARRLRVLEELIEPLL